MGEGTEPIKTAGQIREESLTAAFADVRRLFQCVLTENRIPAERAKDVSATFVQINAKTPATLDEQEEAKLWELYADLVRFAQPATVAGLLTATELETDRKTRPGLFRSWSKDPEARRAVRCAWVTMGITLIVVIALQIYSLVGTKTLQELEKATAAIEQIRKEEAQVRATKPDIDENDQPLKDILSRKATAEKRVFANISMLDVWNGIWRQPLSIADRFIVSSTTSSTADTAAAAIANQQYGQTALQAISLYLLPLFYGLLGASVFVLRRVGSELEQSNFSRTNSYRYRLRYALGAVLGATAGLIFTPTEGGTSNSPAQLATFAFLAGFSVEAVFSQMDAIIAAWRKRSSSSQSQGS